MSVTDPIADALTIIRNASRGKKETAIVRASKLTGQILEILKKERFILDYRLIEDKEKGQGSYKVYLKFQKGKVPAITGIKKCSTPGRRFYATAKKAPKVYGGLGVSILSTSRGILTDEEARSQNVGGELLCQVW
ncbi:MAG: 30S ribosomal protein S8 [Candidatus Omnitrophica bacterium]|nr:30S ribosomal protein S8 [Candidatus Omnitrophota bacterium]